MQNSRVLFDYCQHFISSIHFFCFQPTKICIKGLGFVDVLSFFFSPERHLCCQTVYTFIYTKGSRAIFCSLKMSSSHSRILRYFKSWSKSYCFSPFPRNQEICKPKLKKQTNNKDVLGQYQVAERETSYGQVFSICRYFFSRVFFSTPWHSAQCSIIFICFFHYEYQIYMLFVTFPNLSEVKICMQMIHSCLLWS